MILTAPIETILALDIVFLIFGVIVFFISIKIAKYWDIDKTSSLQYQLEKQSFLTSTIIKYIFILKIPLFIFFIFTLDSIAPLLTGAMCAAGVVNATVWGNYLLIIKLLNLYLFGLWLQLHYLDISYETLPFTKRKTIFFLVLFFLFVAEIVLEFYMFSSLEPNKLVSCCGVLYNTTSNSTAASILSVDIRYILSLFYGVFLSMFFIKNRYIFSLLNFLFIIISIISIIIFFSPYVYELPTHHCPFCFLQKDYYYIGYFIYIFLFLGTFYGISVGFIKKYYRKYSLLFNTVFVLIVSLYVLVYYIKNGVLLWQI